MSTKRAAVHHGGTKLALYGCRSREPLKSVSGRPYGRISIDCLRNELNASSFLQELSAVTRYSSLPWELRHHIHTFCVQGSYDNEVIVRRGTEESPGLLVRQSTGLHSYQWVKDPILQQSILDRIGTVASRELLETYYKTRTFKFIHAELSILQAFLEADSFGLDMRPGDHVQRLHLQLQPFRYAQLREPNAMDAEEQNCHKALKLLLNLHAPHATIEIHADLTQGYCDDSEYNELLGDAAGFIFRVIGFVDRLKNNGLNVEVFFDGRWNGKDGTGVCRDSVHSLNDCVALMKVACQ
jgi:hypothetical protein